VTELRERTVEVNGHPCRVWEKGEGAPLGYVPGYGGLPRWTPFLDKLAERRRVIAPSLPGFPGALGHADLDTHLEWVMAAHDLLDGAGLSGADLVATGFGAALVADVAAIWAETAKSLTLISPFGLFEESDPTYDVWAVRPNTIQNVVVANPDNFLQLTQQPNEVDRVEWQVSLVRANEAAARFLWPLGNTGLAKRLHRIKAPTLLIWGDQDKVIPRSYAKRFADGIKGTVKTETINGAGHLAELDQPDAVAKAVLDFVH
jgi:pimeloyl-ACP methyl ester carboxylesterase